MTLTIKELKSAINVAELLDDDQLKSIGQKVIAGYEFDEASRSDWKEIVDKAMLIAKQTMETKNHPFPNSSNVKYPLITMGAIDFASRTYPELIQNDRVVKVNVMGADPENKKQQRADRVAKFLSYQLLNANDEWEEGLDKLLHILPVLGTVFKKTYFDSILERPVSELCYPDRIVVNYKADSLEKAPRVTHILSFQRNDIVERIRAGLYLDLDTDTILEDDDLTDEGFDIEFLEQHCFLDLDEDGYKEPYVVTIHKESGQVFRIVSRFKKVSKNSQGEVKKIIPEHYFTDFHFIKSPDGGFYSVGLGTLLYPLNSAINTLINQLIDAGTLNNSQGGFLGKGLRLKNGQIRMKLNEWKVLDAASGTDIAKNVVPLPTKEPSGALFQLLGLLIDISKDLVAANDVMQGKGQTQNVPATTILTMVEQGLKVFNAIYKRLFRSFRKEFKKIFELNKLHLSNKEYKNVLDEEVADVEIDFDLQDADVIPVADPSMATDIQRLAKAQAIMSLPSVDPRYATKMYLEALQLDEKHIDGLMPAPDPNQPPPPDYLKTLSETELNKAKVQEIMTTMQLKPLQMIEQAKQTEIKENESNSRITESAARSAKMVNDAANNSSKEQRTNSAAAHDAAMQEASLAHQRDKDLAELQIKTAEVMQKKKDQEKRDKS